MEFTPRQILCPVDLSSGSSLVLGWAGLFAKEYEAEVTILHADLCLPPPYFTQSQIAGLIETMKQERQSLRRSLSRLAKATLDQTVSREILVEEAHPFDAISAWIRVRPPDLVVMGSHGRSGVARRLLGSVSENVMRHVSCPTLIVRRQGSGENPPKLDRMLCPVSFADHDQVCMELSSTVAAKFGAELFMVHAVEEGADDLVRVQEALCDWVNERTAASCRTSGVVREGNAAEQIIRWARGHQVDLVVIGAQHRPFLEYVTLGTTTERVARHSSCPVLIVPGLNR